MAWRETAADLAEEMDLPGEALGGSSRVTLTARRRAVVEYHRGLLGYTAESVEVSAGAERVRILGGGLTLRAMDDRTLIVTGRISGVEYA